MKGTVTHKLSDQPICYQPTLSAKIADMLLAIDVGNTNITLGIWNGSLWQKQWRLRTVHNKTVDEYGVYLETLLRLAELSGQVTATVLSSVVPQLTGTFISVCNDYLGRDPLLISHKTDTGITIQTDNPAEVGADRIVNAAAAYHLHKGNSIVIDMGTATTFDAISKSGELLGVAIAPGLGLAADALSSRAAQLGTVALAAPPRGIGKNTIHAMQSGLIFGYASLIDGMVARFKDELADPTAKVIGTGGLITRIMPYSTSINLVESWLTLIGLREIYLRNQH